MPDAITPVATMIRPPDPMQGINTLSGILGLRQQQQALQTGQYQQQSAAAAASQDQQRNAELQKAQAIALSGAQSGQYTTSDGRLDRQKMADDIGRVAPTYGQGIVGSLLSQANEVVSNRQALQNLNDSQRNALGASFGALATKADLSPSDFIDEGLRQIQNNKDPDFQRMVLSTLTHLPSQATAPQLQQLAQRYALSATGAEGAAAASAPQTATMQGPGGLQPVNLNPRAPGGTGPVGAPMPQGIAPGTITSPMTGGVGIINPAGQVRPVTEAPGQQAAFNPSYPGQQRDIETYRNEVQGVRQEAQQAPLARNINQQILRLSKDARTGPGSDVWQHVIGAVGAPFGLSPTSSYQEVGKFLEKNAIAAMQSMGGPPSDSRLEAAAKANGGTSFSPEALQTVTKFNDATTTALDQYRQGIDRSVGVGQNVDYSKLPAFKAAWAKNFDVNVFRVENAIRDGDQEELQKIRKELGPTALKSLAKKRENLTALTQGQIP
jgi:hypothetical protein